MSDLAILWARRCRVGSSTARLVLLELAHRADPFDATVGISAGSLAEQCEIHPDTARTALSASSSWVRSRVRVPPGSSA